MSHLSQPPIPKGTGGGESVSCIDTYNLEPTLALASPRSGCTQSVNSSVSGTATHRNAV